MITGTCRQSNQIAYTFEWVELQDDTSILTLLRSGCQGEMEKRSKACQFLFLAELSTVGSPQGDEVGGSNNAVSARKL